MRIRRQDALMIAIIIAILIVLLLPEIQKSREAARRDVCTWNLQRIAKAALAHETALSRLPTSSSYYLAGSPDDISSQPLAANTDTSGASCLARISPYLEETPFPVDLAKLFNDGPLFPKKVAKDETATASIPVPKFLCPSFSGGPTSGGVYKKLPYPVAASNYVAIAGPFAARTGKGNAIGTPFGVMNAGALRFGNRGRKIGEVQSSGESNCVLFTESREKIHNAWIDGAATWVTPFRVDQLPAQYADYDGDGTLDGPNHALNFGPGSPNANSKYLTNRHWGPSSEHGGVVIHVFANTRTAALTNDIDESIYRAYVRGTAYFGGNNDAQPPFDTITSDD